MVRNWQTIFSCVRAALMSRGRTHHGAEDLVQEAWVRLTCYEREHVVEKSEAFLMRTALNLSIDAHRTRMSHGEEVALDDVVVVDLSRGRVRGGLSALARRRHLQHRRWQAADGGAGRRHIARTGRARASRSPGTGAGLVGQAKVVGTCRSNACQDWSVMATRQLLRD